MADKDYQVGSTDAHVKCKDIDTLLGVRSKITGTLIVAGKTYEGEIETDVENAKIVIAHIEAFLNSLEEKKNDKTPE